jgi:SAM-dependent methyltransferase
MATPMDALPALVCPDCRGHFRIVSGTRRHGIGSCSCQHLVIADGVVFPARGPRGRRLLEALRKQPGRRPPRVIPLRSWLRVRCMELSRTRMTFRRYLRHVALGWLLTGRAAGEFCRRRPENRLVKPFWGAGQWHLYMQHRFTVPSFLAARAALGLLQGRDGLILDAPCGMGHLSHYLAKMTNPAQIVAMDLDPESAYAARRFFIPNAAAVLVWDMNELLPLQDGSVGAIFCLDAFHYVTDKQALANEFTRVLRNDGVIASLHLHNRLQHNPTPGTPLSPDEYADLFSGTTIRMYPEDHFLRAQLLNDPIDLMQSAPPEDLKKANALMLIVAKDPNTLSELPPTRTALASRASNPKLSYFYTASNKDGKVKFQCSIPPTLRGEYPNITEVLPARWVSTAPLSVNGQSLSADQQSLLEHNIFVDVPDNY